MMKSWLAFPIVALVVLAASVRAQDNWMHYGQDAGATKYSTLTQINTTNVSRLKRAWTFHTGDTSGFFESTPLVIDSVMYFCAQNGIYALDAACTELSPAGWQPTVAVVHKPVSWSTALTNRSSPVSMTLAVPASVRK